MSDWSTALNIADKGAKLVTTIASLISDALNGDDEAINKLRTVDQILSPESPTEQAFERADQIAESKPSQTDSES